MAEVWVVTQVFFFRLLNRYDGKKVYRVKELLFSPVSWKERLYVYNFLQRSEAVTL